MSVAWDGAASGAWVVGSVPLLTEPPGDLAGLVRAQELGPDWG